MPCWIDVRTADLAGTQDFYSALFGWQFDDFSPECGGYYVALQQGAPVASVGSLVHEGDQGAWTTFFATDDVQATVRRIWQAGGQVQVDPIVIPDVGFTALAQDPEGAEFGLWQGGAVNGMQLYDEPNTPVWSDLHTADVDQSATFYAQVLGFDLARTPLLMTTSYRTFDVRGHKCGGMAEMSADSAMDSAYWLPWVGVEDTDSAIVTARHLGAALIDESYDSVRGHWATLVDPFDATLAIMMPASCRQEVEGLQGLIYA